jgi:hypothetical protein
MLIRLERIYNSLQENPSLSNTYLATNQIHVATFSLDTHIIVASFIRSQLYRRVKFSAKLSVVAEKNSSFWGSRRFCFPARAHQKNKKKESRDLY